VQQIQKRPEQAQPGPGKAQGKQNKTEGIERSELISQGKTEMLKAEKLKLRMRTE